MENVNQKTALTEQQSLELITRMISDTRTCLARNSVRRSSWGYATVAVAIFEYFVQSTFTDPAPWLWAWWAIPRNRHRRHVTFARRDTGAKNYLDRTVSAVWAVCSISILTVTTTALGVLPRIDAVFGGSAHRHRHHHNGTHHTRHDDHCRRGSSSRFRR